MRKYKLGKQKKFLMLTSILSIVLLMSTSIAAAAISRSVADSSTSESAESSDVSTSLTSDSADAAGDSAVSDDNVESSPSLSASSAESSPAQPSNAAPIADFSFSPLNPLVGAIVVFDGTASYDPDGVIVSYAWSLPATSEDIGDESIINYIFDQPGNYLVSLEVTDNKGATDIMNKLVMVPYTPSVPSEAEVGQSASASSAERNLSQPSNAAPIADFSFSPLNPLAGAIVIFDGTASYDPDGVIVSYAWSLLATLENIGNESIINYIFDQPGNYLVSLEVTDNKGATDIMSKLVMVPYAPSVPSKVDQSASTELVAISEEDVSNDDETVQTQQQASPSQKLLSLMDLGSEPASQTEAFALIIFRRGSNATIDDLDFMNGKPNMDLTINSGTMSFRFLLGGGATAGPGEQVTIRMFRGLYTPVNLVEGEWITSMLGFGWFSIVDE